MIEFVLYVYMGTTLYNKTQVFADIDTCKYFAERLSNQRSIPQEDGEYKNLTAICLPKNK